MAQELNDQQNLSLPERRRRLLEIFVQSSYQIIDLPILQPIEPFIELLGENIRKKIFTTQDSAARELCLRPEFTIPICHMHQGTKREQSARYAYLGPVFRDQGAQRSQLDQAGVESIGRDDLAVVDTEILKLALQGADVLGHPNVTVKFSDLGLTNALFEALGIRGLTKTRLFRCLENGSSLDTFEDQITGDPRNEALLQALQGRNAAEARSLVEDVLSIGGITHVGGRTVGEIADRFLSKAAAQAEGRTLLKAENRRFIDRYRAIRGNPDDAIAAVRLLIAETGIVDDDVERAVSLFEERTGFMAAQGIRVERLQFFGDFTRKIDYYTGFIFDLIDEDEGRIVAGGGRYDKLLTALGSAVPLPASGCAFFLHEEPAQA